MKILIILPSNPYFSNSAFANRYIGLMNGLMKQGCSLSMLVTGGYKTRDEISLCNEHCPSYIQIHYSLRFVIKGKFSLLLNYIFSNLFDWCNAHIIKKYLTNDYDVVWFGYDCTTLYSFCKYHSKIKAKTFIEINEFNDIGLEGKSKYSLHYRRAFRENTMLLKTLQSIDIVAAMTKTLEKHYQKLAGNECSFIHLPMTVDMSRFDKQNYECSLQSPYIAFAGTMNNAKDGVNVLIESFAKIADKYPNLQLYLAGFWHYDVPMQDEMIERYGLGTRVHRLGVLTSEQIPPFVCNAKLLALARPDSHQAQGGFPTKLGEYLATGNPVCVTKVGEIPDYLEDNVSAFLATPGDVASFADAMDRALCNDDRARSVGAKGRNVAELNFSATLQANRLYDFFNKVISQ